MVMALDHRPHPVNYCVLFEEKKREKKKKVKRKTKLLKMNKLK
jgi:hypothetical protein